MKVKLSVDAEEDLIGIYKFISQNDSREKAQKIYNEILAKCLSLDTLADRGHVPTELDLINIDRFLEIVHLHYRIIYQIFNKEVFIHCILNSRRDVQKILHERLLR